MKTDLQQRGNIKKKAFTSAPLPFMGQKRNFLKYFKEALKNYPEDCIYVDLFGGSGLLSHTLKLVYPNAHVVYNDFDNYRERLENVEKTNSILSDLREVLKDYPRDKRIVGQAKDKVLSIIRKAEKNGYVDFVTISSSLLFSSNIAYSVKEFEKTTLYNCIRKSSYVIDGYLDGLEIVSVNYRELFDKYKDYPNVVFLVDPPYLQTDSFHYKNYWNLSDYLDVLDVIACNSYFYFTSNKSSIIELCEWFSSRTGEGNPFAGAEKKEIIGRVKYNSTYTDIMLYKYEYIE